MKPAIAAATVLLLMACGMATHAPEQTPGRTLGPGEYWVPFMQQRDLGGVPIACAGVGWAGGGHVLTGSPDDPRLVWMMDGKREELEWPVGYSARFTPNLELLDEHGDLVGVEGSVLTGGCEIVPGVWWVSL
jgi:hypothetical protein